jgi:hypothetical protein
MFDGDFDIIETQTFKSAVSLWREHMAEENADISFLDEMPESVELLSEKQIIRENTERTKKLYRCANCMHQEKCKSILGESFNAENTCDWDPPRFKNSKQKIEQQTKGCFLCHNNHKQK